VSLFSSSAFLITFQYPLEIEKPALWTAVAVTPLWIVDCDDPDPALDYLECGDRDTALDILGCACCNTALDILGCACRVPTFVISPDVLDRPALSFRIPIPHRIG
jgi:hypothetical protein